MEFLKDLFECLAGSEPLRPLLSAAGAAAAAAAAAAGLYFCYYCSDERKRTHTAHTPPPADLRGSAAPPLDDRAFQDQDKEPAQHNEAGGQPEQSRLQLPSSLSDYDDMMTKPLQEQNKMLENALYETMDREIDALVAIKDLLYLSSTVYKLQTKVDQLTAHKDECRMMHEGAEKERIESYDALVSGEAVMKLGMETALELYEKEKEANDSLKEKYKKKKESNTQLEAEITEIKDQIHKMDQDEDADMKCDSAAGD